MTYKKKLPPLLAALALFGGCVWWVWSSLSGSFASLAASQQKSAIQSALASVPAGAEEIALWLGRLREQKSGFDLLYVPLGEGAPQSSSAELAEFYGARGDSPLFRRGFESAEYEEIFDAGRFDVGGSLRQVLFAPVYDAERYVAGVALFSFDVESSSRYQHLLTLFAVGGFCLFAALLCIGRLSRDAFLSCSVLGLVLIALVFIV